MNDKNKYVYVVSMLDYEYKQNETDRQNINSNVLRVFSDMKDAIKYVTDFYEDCASPKGEIEIKSLKDGYLYIELKDSTPYKRADVTSNSAEYNYDIIISVRSICIEDNANYDLFTDLHD